MRNTTLNSKLVDNHFRLLKNLDINSKKRLINRLKESMKKVKKHDKLDKLYGAWKDSRTADEIIDDLRKSKINSREIEDI